MIDISFTGDSDQHVVEFLQQSEPRILATIEPTLQLADLMAYIQHDKLQGQVLKSHANGSGLAASLYVRMESAGLSVTGYVGTNQVYARIHEYGFSGTESVRAHMRTQTQAWGHELSPARRVAVRAFSREMVMPARPYMQPSLDEKKEAIVKRIRDAIAEAIEAA